MLPTFVAIISKKANNYLSQILNANLVKYYSNTAI